MDKARPARIELSAPLLPDPLFETLRQACLEPELRTFIGPEPAQQAMPSQTIAAIEVTRAPWLAEPALPINGGLVAIIGARGSGKTALADLIAAGGLALSSQMNERSFIQRALKLIGEAKSRLTWGDGRQTENELKHVNLEDMFDIPHVQYLSQQFVDQLCSSEGVTDALLSEIERVIFQSHSSEARMGAVSFDELRQIKTTSLRSTRLQEEATIRLSSRELIVEQAKKDSLTDLRAQHSQLIANIAIDKRDRQSFVSKDNAARGQELEDASDALSYVRGQVDAWNRCNQQLTALRAEVIAIRKTGAPSQLEQLKLRYPEAGFRVEQWRAFLLSFTGDVDTILNENIANALKNAAAWRGPRQGEITPVISTPPQPNSFIPLGVTLKQQSSTLLAAEVTRLQGLVGIDTANAKKYTALSAKIGKDEVALAKLQRDIEAAEKADERISNLVRQRSEAYRDVFDAITEEETALAELYDPLKMILELEEGALGKLGFSIRRMIDTHAWVKGGESLFDLRNGPFRGKGTLLVAIEALGLEQAWQSGSADDVASAMAEFRKQYGPSLSEHCPVDRRNKEDFRNWISQVFEWLYDTSHISVAYGVQYDGVGIEQLSPGTRGIVLLLLYLTIDAEDDRPLIIDQPEENLDPQSIFDELVHRFKHTKLRRQIIVVTHNANLVVNTDADQVIIATAGPHRPGQLPLISYCSGGLENADIRRQVCNILEGGEAAFKERAKRLRVVL